MSKHTPGPWEVAEEHGDYFVQVAQQPSVCHPMFDRYRIIHGWIGGDRTDNPKAELGTPIANARLIAAAPELLEACQTFAEWLRREEEGLPGGIVRGTPEGERQWRIWWEENLRICNLAQQQVRAAIAKATGEQP